MLPSQSATQDVWIFFEQLSLPFTFLNTIQYHKALSTTESFHVHQTGMQYTVIYFQLTG